MGAEIDLNNRVVFHGRPDQALDIGLSDSVSRQFLKSFVLVEDVEVTNSMGALNSLCLADDPPVAHVGKFFLSVIVQGLNVLPADEPLAYQELQQVLGGYHAAFGPTFFNHFPTLSVCRREHDRSRQNCNLATLLVTER
ncbi:hypothetical protein E2A64_05600 [Pseudohoeflea suaedae]|uniref:Uncharacterized protein n=1 Tax=Pseudohoeflea suaedae TaxID=877384 RepID=A0A4R5PNG7_9HYPH|nr:hypothetical protein [Pseudohoeflea suaedae]TDH38576.1 hypothetical protein E2A64_05600 [Pseudohoeflea suaedae]